jgi:hypothetical protein
MCLMQPSAETQVDGKRDEGCKQHGLMAIVPSLGTLQAVLHPAQQVLGLSFRARELTLVAAGMAAVQVTGVENVDLRAVVKGHTDYSTNMSAILNLLGFAE